MSTSRAQRKLVAAAGIAAVGFALAVMFMLCACSADLKEMEFDQLRTNCTAEIERASYSSFKKVGVVEFKLLAWYRIRDTRPWHVDNALCWAKASTDQGLRYVLVHMARNPNSTLRKADLSWHSYFVYDAPNAWFLYFEHPPKNEDIYNRMTWFTFDVGKEWKLYDSQVLSENWQAATGERPTRGFSNKSVQRTEGSRSAQKTNRTLSAVGSRR